MVARLGDPVVQQTPCNGGCNSCPHPWTGKIISGSSNTTVNGIPMARQNDKGVIMCPHAGTFKITVASNDAKNSQGMARISDMVMCDKCGATGRIISGSPNVLVNKK